MQNSGGHGSSSGGNSFTHNYSYSPRLDEEGWLTMGNGTKQGHMWDRFYTCSYCKKTFFTSQALRGHQNSHRLEREALRRAYEQSTNKHVMENQTPRTDACSWATVRQSNRVSDHEAFTGDKMMPQKRVPTEVSSKLGAGNGSRRGKLHTGPEHDSSQVYRDQMVRLFSTQTTKNLLRGMEMKAAEGNRGDSEATVTCPTLKKTCWCGCESASSSGSDESDNEASSNKVDLTLKL